MENINFNNKNHTDLTTNTSNNTDNTEHSEADERNKTTKLDGPESWFSFLNSPSAIHKSQRPVGSKFHISVQGKVLKPEVIRTNSRTNSKKMEPSYDLSSTESYFLLDSTDSLGDISYIRISLDKRIELIHPTMGVLEVIDSDTKARRHGLTPEKLAKVLISGINPTLALNNRSFILFLMQKNAGFATTHDPKEAAKREAQVGHPHRVSLVCEELLGLTGLPVVLNFGARFKFQHWLRTMSAGDIARSITRALGSGKLVAKTWIILIEYLTFITQNACRLGVSSKTKHLDHFLTAAIGFMELRQSYAKGNLMMESPFDIIQVGDKLGSSLGEELESFPKIMTELQSRAVNSSISYKDQDDSSWKSCVHQWIQFAAHSTMALQSIESSGKKFAGLSSESNMAVRIQGYESMFKNYMHPDLSSMNTQECLCDSTVIGGLIDQENLDQILDDSVHEKLDTYLPHLRSMLGTMRYIRMKIKNNMQEPAIGAGVVMNDFSKIITSTIGDLAHSINLTADLDRFRRQMDTISDNEGKMEDLTPDANVSGLDEKAITSNEYLTCEVRGLVNLLNIARHKLFNLQDYHAIRSISIQNAKSSDRSRKQQWVGNYNTIIRKAEEIAVNPHSIGTNSTTTSSQNEKDTTKGNVCQRIVRHNRNFGNIFVINSTCGTVYTKWMAVVSLICSNYDKASMKENLEKLPALIDLISDSDMEAEDLDKLRNELISRPPSFVNDDRKANLMTDPYGIPSKDYVDFVKIIFTTLTAKKIEDAKTDATKKTKLQKDVASLLADFLDKIHERIKDKMIDGVIYTLTDKKNKSTPQGKSFLASMKHQLSITLATIFACITDREKYKDHACPIKWTFERIRPVAKTVIDIKANASIPTDIDLNILLKCKRGQRDTVEARLTMNEKLVMITQSEEKTITKPDEKKTYTDIIIPGVKKYVDKHFKNTIDREDTAGITSLRSLLSDAKSDSLFVEVLTFLHSEADKALAMQALSETIVIDDSDGEDVILPICSHKVKLIEPPSFSENCKNIHKFSPPTYLQEKHGDFIEFIETVAMRYIRKFPQMSYADKGIAIWWLFKSDRLKNLYMKHFGKFLNNVSINGEKEFQSLYVQVARKLFPEQVKTPIHYQDQLRDREWLSQGTDEDFDELLERIKDCLENAYPNEHTSDVNRVRLANTFYEALNNRFYQKFIDEHHYEDFFHKGKINHVITQLNKKKKIRLEQKKRNQHHVTSVRSVQDKKHSPNVNRNSKNSANKNQDFRLSQPGKGRLKNDGKINAAKKSTVNKDTSRKKNIAYVNNKFEKSNRSDNRRPTVRNPERKSTNFRPKPGRGASTFPRRTFNRAANNNTGYMRRDNRTNSYPMRGKSTNYSDRGQRQQNQQRDRRPRISDVKEWGKLRNDSRQQRPDRNRKPVVSDLKKEITFLTRNKNIKPNGGFWVNISEIDKKISSAPGFNLKNYIPEKQWKTTVRQAESNLQKRKEKNKDSRDQAVRTRRNKRKLRSMHRRQNVVVNRREVNLVRSNMYAISSETCRNILRLQKEQATLETTPETDSYKIMVKVGTPADQSSVKAIIDSGAGVNLAGLGVYEKLKRFGKFQPVAEFETPPRLRGASNDQLQVTGALNLDLKLGNRTEYQNCRILVSDSVPSNFFVLGTEFLTDLKHQLSFLFAPIFHRIDCKNMGQKDIKTDCTTDCAVTTNAMIMNPTCKHNCDIIKFIPSGSSHVKFLEHHEEILNSKTPSDLRMGTYTTVDNQAMSIRFVTNEKISFPPNTMKVVKIEPQEEEWCPNTKTFIWKKMNIDDQEILVVASPTKTVEKHTLMRRDEEEAIYNIAENIYLVKNHTDETFQIGKGTAIADCFTIA